MAEQNVLKRTLTNESAGNAPKGILKGSSVSQLELAETPPVPDADTLEEQDESKKPRLKWDENNLHLTSIDRGTRQKILEPKTPYVHYDSTNDRVMTSSGDFVQLPPFALNEALESYKEEDLLRAGLCRASINSENGSTDNLVGGKREWDSSDSDTELLSSDKKHEEFERKRQEHYKMKDAFALGSRKVSFVDDSQDESGVETNGFEDPANDEDYSKTGMYEASDSASGKLSLDLRRHEFESSDDDESVDDDFSGRIVQRGHSISSSSSQLRLYMQQPVKPALVNNTTTDDDGTTVSVSSSKRDKHVRIVDSRSRRQELASGTASPGSSRRNSAGALNDDSEMAIE